ncbi:MAG TPA: methyltransferase domain-containing protein [Burkholderiaceae bacterium]|nr:methyltransferase domain-containing protein [Burkholderiaceae bacterium]
MAEIEDRHWWYRGLRAVIRQAWERSIAAPRPTLLDVGCGTGANLAALADRSEPIGIDLAPEAIAFCRRRGLMRTLVGSADRLPFADGGFDVALSCDVLSHWSLSDKAAALREMQRVLRPGGTLLLNVPAYQWLLSQHDVAVHQDRRFSRREIAALLAQTGFEPIWVSHWNAALLPAAVAVRWLRRARQSGSDLAAGSGEAAGAVFGAVLAAERALLRRFALPFGLSVFAVARRRG